MAAFHDYLAALMKAVGESRSSGNSGDALMKAVLPSLAEKYGQWGSFKGFGPRKHIRDRTYGTMEVYRVG